MLYLVYYENKCKNNKIEMPIYCATNEQTKNKIVDAYEAQNPDYKLSVKTFSIDTQPETKSVFFLKKIFKNTEDNEFSSEVIDCFLTLKDANENKEILKSEGNLKNVKYTISEVLLIHDLLFAVEKIKTTFENGKYKDKIKILNLCKDYGTAKKHLDNHLDKKSKFKEQYRISLNDACANEIGDEVNILIDTDTLCIINITKEKCKEEKKTKVEKIIVEQECLWKLRFLFQGLLIMKIW